MGTLALKADERVKNVHISDDVITVDLMDGRSISVPLIWYPRLGRQAAEGMASTGLTLMKT